VVLVQTGELAADLGHTLGVALLAAGITLTLGGILGLAIGLAPAVRRYTMSSIDFLRTIPAVALVPVAVLTFGPAVTTELILAAYAALWPIVLNSSASCSTRGCGAWFASHFRGVPRIPATPRPSQFSRPRRAPQRCTACCP
jgi:sulfonate transport system permease protein